MLCVQLVYNIFLKVAVQDIAKNQRILLDLFVMLNKICIIL